MRKVYQVGMITALCSILVFALAACDTRSKAEKELERARQAAEEADKALERTMEEAAELERTWQRYSALREALEQAK